MEQYSALIEIMPQIETALRNKGEKVPRPLYGGEMTTGVKSGEDEEEDGSDARGDTSDARRNDTLRKSNIDVTSDEEED